MGNRKWLFGLLGWAAVGPIGGVMGFMLGSWADRRVEEEYTLPPHDGTETHHGPYRNTGSQADLDVALLVLIAAVMKCDGVVLRSELNHVKAFLRRNYSEEQAKELMLLLRDLVKQDIDVRGVCRQIKVNTDSQTRYLLFEFLFSLAASDGEVAVSELHLLRTIATALGISSQEFLSLSYRYADRSRSASEPAATSLDDAYSTLGVAPSATDDEVRRAYRRLAMKHHPDRVATMSEAMRKNAEEQMTRINTAYDRVVKARGMK